MRWEEEVLRVLEVSEITEVLPDKLLFHISARNNSDMYVTYRLINERPAYKTGINNEMITTFTIQIDVNSKKRDKIYKNLVELIKSLAKSQNWIKGAVFEDEDLETGIFFNCIRFDFNLIN